LEYRVGKDGLGTGKKYLLEYRVGKDGLGTGKKYLNFAAIFGVRGHVTRGLLPLSREGSCPCCRNPKQCHTTAEKIPSVSPFTPKGEDSEKSSDPLSKEGLEK
jgi:hypothetical protein